MFYMWSICVLYMFYICSVYVLYMVYMFYICSIYVLYLFYIHSTLHIYIYVYIAHRWSPTPTQSGGAGMTLTPVYYGPVDPIPIWRRAREACIILYPYVYRTSIIHLSKYLIFPWRICSSAVTTGHPHQLPLAAGSYAALEQQIYPCVSFFFMIYSIILIIHKKKKT